MDDALRSLRSRPWTTAAAVYAWGTAVVLTILIQLSTLVLVIPPTLVATTPLLMPPHRQPLITVIAAAALALWALVGIALLGLYFLPSAILLGIGYVRARTRQLARN